MVRHFVKYLKFWNEFRRNIQSQKIAEILEYILSLYDPLEFTLEMVIFDENGKKFKFTYRTTRDNWDSDCPRRFLSDASTLNIAISKVLIKRLAQGFNFAFEDSFWPF